MNGFMAALCLAVIEGTTEFLPISSTGHLLVAEHWLGQRSEFFNVIIQLAAFIAVLIYYRDRWRQLLGGWRSAANRDYLLKIGVAFLVTVLGGLLIKRLGWQLSTDLRPIAWALIGGALVIFVAERVARHDPMPEFRISWWTAVWVGIAQVIAAVFPGSSRSLCTIFAAMISGVRSRPAATEFSFLLGIPTLFAASAYELRGLSVGDPLQQENLTELGMAFVGAGLTAYVATAWLLRYVRSHDFQLFAWYRLLFGGVLLLLAR